MIPINTLRDIVKNDIDIETATIRAALIKDTTAYSPDAVNHSTVDDVLDGGPTAEEYDDTNYSRQDVSGMQVTSDTGDVEVVIDWDPTTWPSLGPNTGGQTVQGVLFYVQVGGDDSTPGDDPVLKVVDDSETSELPKQTNGDDWQWSTAAEGAINLTPQ
jgi:hypothetical protein